MFKFWYFLVAPLITFGVIYLMEGISRTTNIFAGRPIVKNFGSTPRFAALVVWNRSKSVAYPSSLPKALAYQIETGAAIPAFHLGFFINALVTTGLSGTILIYCVIFIRYLKVNNFIANFLFLTFWPLVHFKTFHRF